MRGVVVAGLAIVASTWVMQPAQPAQADRAYVVRPGDTLARIARRFRTNIPALRRANSLRSDDLRAGAEITIPTGGTAIAARRAGQHLVRSGDSLSAIAQRYRVPLAELRRANRLRSDNIRPGMRLQIPGRRRENRMPDVEPVPVRDSQEGADERAEELGLGSRQAAQRILSDTVDPRWARAAANAPAEIPEDARALDDQAPLSPTAPGTLRHPLAGEERHFMRGWGSGAGGYHLALDLFAPPGSEIRAADRGIVAYAGSGLTGYGRFVILVHPSGRATAYAHNQQVLVKAGEYVAQGQVISLLGNTGLSRGPHLHFMLISGGEHCDPAPLLRPLPRQRDGDPAAGSGVAWTGESRPVEVRCLARESRPHPGLRRRRRR